ncbi:DUF4238 domain-containing protein [Nucisporomicrobium flavum]|uniref:DUF4238 domain-containing protein n=1 Tax=Nucisporomicrobium flavum TaxID=2785915 RepID=UPI0018F58E9B|nr:DUF4238 domain-containing protein [Nucisporomicrobium flavum]
MARDERLRRRHHIVPKFHLRRFANTRDMLRRVPLAGGEGHLVSINDATVERDFYLVQDVDGQQHDDVEKLLSDVESDASTAVGRVVNQALWPIDQDTRMAIVLWAALQLLRTSFQRQVSDEIADVLLKLQIGAGGKPQLRTMLRRRDGREPTDEKVDSLWATLSDFDSYRIQKSRNAHVSSMLGAWPDMTALLLMRGWQIFRFDRKALVTCDNPVTLIAAPDHPTGRGVGVGNAGMILLPLDRRVALVMAEPGGVDEVLPTSTMVAEAFNGHIVMNAHRAVFHHPEDDPLAGFPLPPARSTITNAGDRIADFVFPDGMPPAPLPSPTCADIAGERKGW